MKGNYKTAGKKAKTGEAIPILQPCWKCGKLTANLKQKCVECLNKDESRR